MREAHKISQTFVITLVFTLGACFAFGQNPPKPPPPLKPNWKSAQRIQNETDKPAEKSIAVDAGVNISLCVSEGKLKINGWDRREVRAFVSRGTQVGYTVLQKNRENNDSVWIKILGYDPAINKETNIDECLAGDEIEIDAPRGATVNIKSRESEMQIDSISKVTVENGGGDIYLSNIRRGVEAKTYAGSVTVGNSGGAMTLSATTGNIIVFNVSPSEIGDIFKARSSSGAITLKNIAHRQLEVNSSTGSISFNGEFTNGGQYVFGTSNGSIALSVPPNASLSINASYGYGAFDSEIPLDKLEKSGATRFQSLAAQIGAGEASVKLTTAGGAIRIRRQ